MDVARLQLDDVDLCRGAHALEVPLAKDRPLAQVRTEVVDEYASFYMLGCRRPAVETNCTHQLRG